MISKDDLTTLVEAQTPLCLSLYMPTVRAGEETQQNPIRFKNMLRQAEERLVDAGLSGAQARDLLDALDDTTQDDVFWQHQGDGLALFRSPDFLQVYTLPLRFEEQVFVGKRFLIKPLLPLFSGGGRFFILALSQNQVRQLEGRRYHVDEVDLEDVPKSLDEALAWDDPERQLQLHATKGAPTGGDVPTPAFHGHGAGKLEENQKNDILRYFQKVDRGLRDYLAEEKAPLVLAGVEYLFPIFRQASDYQHVVEAGVGGNPEELSAEELHQRAWELVQPEFQKAEEEAKALFQQQLGMGTGRASQEVGEIVPAAYYGRVGQLFLQQGQARWGTFDPQTGAVSLHPEDQDSPEDMDLLDFAAAYTYLNNGEVYLLQPSRMPEPVPAAAVFRY